MNKDNKKIKMRPELNGGFWMIGDNPDLSELKSDTLTKKDRVQECVDHHIFKADDEKWHLWGCIRGTSVGRILYHWCADSLTDEHWEKTGEILRCEPGSGENMRHWDGDEWIQSPYVIKENGKYYMFYGGHSTEWDAYGKAEDNEPYASGSMRSALSRGQICLMVSEDGLNWKRYKNSDGQTRLFAGPGESRDPMLLKIGSLWYLYCAGGVVTHHDEFMPQNYVRTSENLINWSDWQVVHYDYSVLDESNNSRGVFTHECPFVIEHAGYYYLLRTENYAQQRTHVYRSDDPKDFGLGDKAAQSKYVGILPVGAPEIITDENGVQYITSNHNLVGGTMICKLKWVNE